jgi:hypothetical protein
MYSYVSYLPEITIKTVDLILLYVNRIELIWFFTESHIVLIGNRA